jgi:hypothetical protein
VAYAVSPEEQFALDAYLAPGLTNEERLARLVGGMPANDPVAAPSNDNGLPAIPAGPPIPVEATAQHAGGSFQFNPNAPVNLGGLEMANEGREVSDATAYTQPNQAVVDETIDRLNRNFANNTPEDIRQSIQEETLRRERDAVAASAAATKAEAEWAKEDGTAPAAPGAEKGGEFVFPGQPGAGAAPPAAPRPQVVTVGTDRFQPVARTTRGAVDLAQYEQGPPGEPEFGVAGFETQTVTDPKTGKQIKTKVPKGLAVAPGEPGEIRRKELEPQFQEAEGKEEQAQLDQAAGREYADDAILRQAVAVEDKIRDIEQQRINQETERLRRVQEKQNKFEAVLAETGNDENPVDAYFARMDTGEQITKGIALFLGTLGSAISGGENPAMKLIDSAIQAEIEAQRDKRRQRIEGARTLYDMAGEIFDSEAARDAATREAAYARVQREIERFKTFAQTPERRAQFDEMLAQAEQRRLGAQAQRIQATQGEVSVQERFDPKRSVVVGGPSKPKPEDRKRQVRLPNGDIAWVSNDNLQKDVQDKLTGGSNVARAQREMLEIVRTPGWQTSPKLRGRFDAIKVDLAPIISTAKEQGAMTDDEFSRMSRLLGDENAIVQDNGSRLEAAIRQQENRNRSVVRDYVYRDPDATDPYIRNENPASAQEGAAR